MTLLQYLNHHSKENFWNTDGVQAEYRDYPACRFCLWANALFNDVRSWPMKGRFTAREREE